MRQGTLSLHHEQIQFYLQSSFHTIHMVWIFKAQETYLTKAWVGMCFVLFVENCLIKQSEINESNALTIKEKKSKRLYAAMAGLHSARQMVSFNPYRDWTGYTCLHAVCLYTLASLPQGQVDVSLKLFAS